MNFLTFVFENMCLQLSNKIFFHIFDIYIFISILKKNIAR